MKQPERDLADKLLEDDNIVYLTETNEFARYNGGYYHRGQRVKHKLEQRLSDITEDYMYDVEYASGEVKSKAYVESLSRRRMIFEFLKGKCLDSIASFDVQWDRVNCKNGHIFPLKLDGSGDLLWYEHFEVEEHPYKTFMQLPVKYDPEAECPNILRFIHGLIEEKDIPDLFKMMAYMLMPHNKYQKAFIMYGPPKTGKTTFYMLLLRFLGDRNAQQIPLHTLMEDQFALANLRDKWCCMWDEMPRDKKNNHLNEYDIFKIIVTNPFIEARVMFQQERVKFKNFCKLFYTTNTLPDVPEDTGDDFFRRWRMFGAFNVVKEANRDLLDELTTDEELSGLLNEIIPYYQQLIIDEGFDENIAKLKGLWLLDSNKISLFLEECCIIGPNEECDYDTFNYVINRWREDKNASTVTNT